VRVRAAKQVAHAAPDEIRRRKALERGQQPLHSGHAPDALAQILSIGHGVSPSKMRRAWIATAVSLALLGFAPGAGAATATYTEWWDKYGLKATITVTAAPGERNDIVVQTTGPRMRITDSVPLTAGPGCAPEADGSVTCPAAYAIRVEAGDLDDRLRLEHGSAGNDLRGGAGDDVLVAGDFGTLFDGGPGNDRLVGGSGSDFFLEGEAANGGDVMEGDVGDTVVYTKRSRAVRADLDAEADDGERGERDRIGDAIGTVLGGSGPDILVGTRSPTSSMGRAARTCCPAGAGRTGSRAVRTCSPVGAPTSASTAGRATTSWAGAAATTS
jgi:hypothetical protein